MGYTLIRSLDMSEKVHMAMMSEALTAMFISCSNSRCKIAIILRVQQL